MDNSAATQRAIILGYLQRGLHLTTRYARTNLDIMNPSARVGELRKLGYDIVAHKRSVDGQNTYCYQTQNHKLSKELIK